MADEKKVSGKTRAGGAAKPFPWEEAIAEQYERTKSRLKGLATEPEAELQRILEQYLPKKSDSREERLQKLEDLAMGFAGTTIGKGVLPTAAREQGLQKFLEPSAVKDRLYHGTSRPDLTEFKTGKMIKEKQYPGNTIEPWAVDNRDAVFLTPSSQFSGRYSGGDWEISGGYTPTTYPVRVQVKNPWDYENPEHIESVIQAYKEKYPLRRDKSGAVPSEESLRHHWFEKNVRELPLRERDNWSGVEKADLQEIIRSLGHDAFFVKESGIKNLGVYDPRKIKSAIGNRGTYDITDPDITKAEGGLAMQAGGVPSFMKLIKKLTTDIKKAEKAGDTASALAKRNELNEAIRFGVNDPMMPRAQPLTQAELRMYAERMAPQVAGEMTREAKGAKTVAGKAQKQFKREQTLPVERSVLPGAVDPSAPLPYMTLEDQTGSVLLGLPGDPTLARVNLSGIGDVPFERPVTLHGGPRYGDEEKLWASNLGAATGLLSAADRASRQYGNAPVIASYMKMPSGLGFAQHYLESLLQYQRPDQLTKKAQQALTKDIKEGFINPQGKRVTFPDFPGFGDMDAVLDMALTDTNLRKHLADRLEKSEKYGLRPAADVQFAVSHPELTNLETGASGFTLGELRPAPLTESAHPTYSHDIPGRVLGQTRYPTPYDLLYRDQLEMIRQNPKAPEFNTLKLMGARQKIDEQLVNEINEYQERMRQLLGRKKGGAVKKAEGGDIDANVFAFKDPYSNVAGLNASLGGSPLEDVDVRAIASLIQNASPQDIKKLMLDIELAKRFGLTLDEKGVNQLYAKIGGDNSSASIGYSPQNRGVTVNFQKSFADGGKVNGGSKFELPDEVNPSNWREHLQNNVRADARALLGAKDGGVINLDELIEKSLKKKDGGVINLDELIAWTLAKDEHRKMKEGGAVKMQGGGNPGEVAGDMFKPKPLSIPEPITSLVEALRRQFEKEKRSMSKPGAVQDVLMRGPVAAYAGAPADILGMGGELLDYAQKKIPALRKPASVMDTGPEKTPPMGYAPMFPLSPEGSYGTTAAQEMMGKAGLTTGEERPLFEMGATAAAPIAGYAGFKAGKALAPTAMEMLDVELANMMKPYQMAVAPEGKAGKVKAPANPVGFYNPAEKAALNLQRKKGPGSAFISDLKKQPGVTDERIAELGLTDLASNPNVTREEVIAAVEQNRIPLRESVRRPYDEAAEYSDTISGIEDSLIYYRGGVKDVQAELERVRKMAPNSPLVKQYEDKLAVMRDKVDELEAKLDSTKPAKFGPDIDESYSLPGGEDYREIRVRLPSKRPSIKNMSRDEYNAAIEKADREGISDFMHQSHHDNEPNVLFHLRVANHVDEEGKRGLLIDELQSDWHQQGREKGYQGQLPEGSKVIYVKDLDKYAVGKDGEVLGFGATEQEAIKNASRQFGSPPDAPFKDNWYQLGLKRAIKEAADTGMDRVYLTTGARQADRYDLSKQLSRVSYQDGVLHGYDKSGSLVVNKAMTPDELPNYVGKDLGKKMVENAQKDAEIRNKISVARYEGRPESEINALRSQLDGVKTDYAGVDLKVGGEGMKQYYDKNYKNYLEKYAKQHGGKLGMTRLEIGGEQNNWPAFRDWFAAKYPPGSARGGSGTALYQWEEGANNKFVKEFIKGLEKNYEPVYYIDLTDAMRESAKKGQSYADGGGVFNTDPDITDAGRIIPEHTI